MRLIGGDTVITAALLPLLGFFLLRGLQDVPWHTIACVFLVGLLLTATIFGLNNVTDVKIDARDPLKQTNGINPIALGQLTQREAMIPRWVADCWVWGWQPVYRCSPGHFWP